MRRSDKEITDKKMIEQIFNKAEVIRLAMVDEGEPYLVAMNFAYVNGFLYMHSATQGRKIDILMKYNKVAFQTDTGVEFIIADEACESTTRYMSVVGTGNAFLIDEKEEKMKVIDAIMTKHAGRTGFEYSEKAFERTLVIKVVIDSMTGKKSGY